MPEMSSAASRRGNPEAGSAVSARTGTDSYHTTAEFTARSAAAVTATPGSAATVGKAADTPLSGGNSVAIKNPLQTPDSGCYTAALENARNAASCIQSGRPVTYGSKLPMLGALQCSSGGADLQVWGACVESTGQGRVPQCTWLDKYKHVPMAQRPCCSGAPAALVPSAVHSQCGSPGACSIAPRVPAAAKTTSLAAAAQVCMYRALSPMVGMGRPSHGA